MKVTNSFTLETSMYSKTISKQMINDPNSVNQSIQSVEQKDKLLDIQLQQSDLHSIAKSFLISTAQYIKLEKELEKEWKLSVGWFKPSRLQEVTDEAVRDKHKRENAMKKKGEGKKDGASGINIGQLGGGRKRVEKVNSSSNATDGQGNLRRKLSKMNTNLKIGNTKEGNGIGTAIRKPVKKNNSLLNVGSQKDMTQEKPPNSSRVEKNEKKGPNSASSKKRENEETKEAVSSKAVKKQLKGPKIQVSLNKTNDETAVDASAQSVVTKLKSWKEFFELDEFDSGIASMVE